MKLLKAMFFVLILMLSVIFQATSLFAQSSEAELDDYYDWGKSKPQMFRVTLGSGMLNQQSLAKKPFVNQDVYIPHMTTALSVFLVDEFAISGLLALNSKNSLGAGGEMELTPISLRAMSKDNFFQAAALVGFYSVGNMLIRMRELSMQGATDTISDTERGFINQEVQNLKEEVQRIANTTKFGNIDLLSGQGPELEIQVGIGSSAENDRLKYDTKNFDSTVEKLGLMEVSTATKLEAQANLDIIDGAISKVSENRATFGAIQNRLQSTTNNLMISYENLSAANSRIRDADVAAESAELIKRNILTQAGTSTLAQANSNSMLALKLVG